MLTSKTENYLHNQIFINTGLTIPSDLLLLILERLPLIDLKKAKRVSKKWCQLINEKLSNELKINRIGEGKKHIVNVTKSAATALFAYKNYLFWGCEDGSVFYGDYKKDKNFKLYCNVNEKIDFLFFVNKTNLLVIVSNQSLIYYTLNIKKFKIIHKQDVHSMGKILVSNICSLGTCALFVRTAPAGILVFNSNHADNKFLTLADSSPSCLHVRNDRGFRIENKTVIAFSLKTTKNLFTFEVDDNAAHIESTSKYLLILCKKESAKDFNLAKIYEINSGDFLYDLKSNFHSLYSIDEDRFLLLEINVHIHNVTTRKNERTLKTILNEPIIQAIRIENLLLFLRPHSFDWWIIDKEANVCSRQKITGASPVRVNYEDSILKIAMDEGSIVLIYPNTAFKHKKSECFIS